MHLIGQKLLFIYAILPVVGKIEKTGAGHIIINLHWIKGKGGDEVKVVLDVNPSYAETTVTIHCNRVDEMVKNLIQILQDKQPQFIIGKKDEMHYILRPEEIHSFRADGDVVQAITDQGAFVIKERLYELEEMLPASQFVRISKSVIANLYELRRFEASFNGSLCVYFKSGEKEYVSRHYVKRIKKALKMNRREKG